MQKDGHQSVVCYGRGQKTNEANAYKTCGELYSKLNNLLSRFTGIMYGGCFLSTNQLIRIINREKPDVVHIHCINGYFVNIYRLISFLKKSGIPTLLTLHAEFMYTANCGHAFDCDQWKDGCGNCPRLRKETKSLFFDRTHCSWKKMKKAFENFESLTVVSVSPWLQGRAGQAPILSDGKHCTVLNGIDTSIFSIALNSRLKQDMGWNRKKIIFHVTAEFSTEPDHNKGGYYVVELANRFLNRNDDVLFLVAGRCKKADNIPSNIILL
jgi:glycosyltransferase involved in cell wall biosynthesis